MQRKTEIIIAVSVIVLLLVLLGWFLLSKAPTPATDVREIPVADTKPNVPSVDTASIPPQTSVNAATMTKVFVERFGSYSSESDFANIEDVKALATSSFANELDLLAKKARTGEGEDAVYYGVSTKVISESVEEETATTATVRATTQRQEAVGNPGNATVKYQDITVTLQKEGGEWKIAGFTWSE